MNAGDQLIRALIWHLTRNATRGLGVGGSIILLVIVMLLAAAGGKG